MSILKTLRKWITGKSDEDEKKKKRDALRVTNYGGGASRNDTKAEVKRSIQKAERAKAQAEKSSSAFKATPPSVKKAEEKDKQTKPTQSSAFKATSPKQSTALGTVSQKEIDRRTAKRNAFEANRKEQSRAADKLKPLIDKKYDASTKEGRQRIKMGDYQSDPNVMKYETLKHPIATSATRGALSGTTFGLSELAAAKLPKSKEVEEAERLYQANKSKGAEFAGEMVGSLAGFGLTSDLSKVAISKAAPKLTAKLGERTTERLATNKLVMNAARKEATRKLGAAATEEEVKRFAKARAAKLVAALGEDAAINLTTGAVSDVSHAIIDSDSPAEFVKNLGISAGMNLGLGGLATVAPALYRGSALDDSIRAMGDDAADFGRDVIRNIDNKSGGIKLPTDEVRVRDELVAERNALRKEYEAAKASGGDVTRILDDMQELDLMISDAERKIPKAAEQPTAEQKRRVGYHAGDKGKAEWYGNQAGSNRHTGHYGTGTYFSGSEEILEKEGYGNRPRHEIVFDNYNMYRPKDKEQGLRVHNNLKKINRESNDIDSLMKRAKLKDKDVSDLIREYEYATELEDYERIAEKIYSEKDREAIKEQAEERLKYWRKNNINPDADWEIDDLDDLYDIDDLDLADFFVKGDKDIEDLIKKSKTRAEERAKNAKPVPPATYEQAYRTVLPDTIQKDLLELRDNGNEIDRAVKELAEDLGIDEETVGKALDKVQKVVNGYDTRGFAKEDSASTILMKELGFEGVDVTGIDGLDNTEYGSVIYDLRPEDARLIKEGKPRVKEKAKATPPETKTGDTVAGVKEEPAAKQTRKVDEKVEEAVNNEYVERERNAKKINEKYRDYDKEIREVTNGELGERKGVVSVGKGSNPKEQKRVLAKMGREADSIINSNGAIENADAFETAYRTWNAPRKASTMQKSYAKASESVNDIADSIKAKVESFTKNPDNGTGMKIEDVFDMIAVKQVYKDSGMEMPADLQEAFTKLILANKTEHAQGLSVIEQVLREFDPDYRKAFIRKDFDKFLSRFGNVESWDEVAASLDRNHKTDGYLQKKLQELVDFKVGESGTAEEYKKLYKDLQNEILRNSKPNLWNMLDSLRHTFMLSNLATAGRNIYGNASQRIMYDISDALTAQFEASLERRIARNPEVAKKYGEGFERTTTSLLKSKDNRAFASLGRIREGKLGAGLSKITDDAAKAADSEYIKMLEKNLKEDVQDVMGYEKLMPHLEKGMDYAPKNAGEKLATKAYKLSQKGGKVVSFMLNEPDSWFVERNYRTALAKYLEANGITNMASLKGKEEVLKRAREHAKDVALENTYKKANRLTTFIERARAAGKKQGANPLQMAGSIALDAELPYVKVPVNMFINNVKYSPVGIATNGWKAIKAAHIGDVQGLQKSVAELSKGVTGTGLAALGFMLACDEDEQMDNDSIGIISKANEALKKYGIRDNSVKVGEYNFNIADIGLGATQFLMGAAYAEALNENGGVPKGLLGDANAVLDAFRSTFDVVGDLSLMDNFMQTIDAFSTGYGDDVKLSDRVENASMQILPNYVNQYIPNPLRAVAKGTTKADLDTGTRNGKDVSKLEKTLKRNINNQIQGIPVVNEKGIKGTKFEGLPHKVDNHGNLISTGLYPEGRDTKKKKAVQSLVNYADPLATRRIKIPEADKVELKVKDENGKGYEPKAFDENREYKADIGKGKLKETVDLTGKEREKVATSMKKSGKDMARNLVDRGWFGDSHGKRAMEILSKVPEDEEKAREFFYNTTEFKRLNDEEKTKFFNDEYDKTKGRGRTANKTAYVDVKGNSEGDFRFTNDLTDSWKEKYDTFGIGQYGVDKGTYADVLDEIAYAHHKYKDGKNVDTINTKGKTIAALLANEDLTKEQRIAIYNAVRGNRIWKDWDGVSGAGGYYRRGWRRWHRWHRGGSRGSSAKMDTAAFKAKKTSVSAPKKVTPPKTTVNAKSSPTAGKATNASTKSLATSSFKGGSKGGSSSSYSAANVKYNTASAVKKTAKKKKTTVKVAPPKVKFKKYEV